MKSKKGGFTLIELSAVILLMALLVAAVTPNLANLKRGQSVRSFWQQAPAFLREARERAIREGREVRVAMEGETTLIQTAVTNADETAQPNDETSSERSLELPEGIEASKFQADGEDRSSSDWEVTFGPEGQAQSAAIQFEADGEYRTILIRSNGDLIVDREALTDATPTDDRWEAGENELRSG